MKLFEDQKINGMNPMVDFNFIKEKIGREVPELSRIILYCQLKEELKWRVPCYAPTGGNDGQA